MPRPATERTAVVAVGGNALTREGEAGTYAEQWRNATRTALAICRLVKTGYRVILTHGNGPQVGSLSIQQEEGSRFVPPQPLSELVAMTQGALGNLLSLALRNASGGSLPVVALVTHVEVSTSDPAFRRPSKPIGPFFPKEVAEELAHSRQWVVREDARRGFRRVVPSPDPKAIVEADAIRELVALGFVVIAGGGGGVPVARRGRRLAGVDAVIDKDMTAATLASSVEADTLVFLTGVSQVYLDYGTPRQRPVAELTTAEAERYLHEGQFAEGSMGPKVAAALRFLSRGGRLCCITSTRWATAAVAGSHGTRIVAPAVGPMAGEETAAQQPTAGATAAR
ncbi:MAG TPA: carbamate kinase [Actinomycetota bacterium]|nr:carbamate kinase [Actinomycetota bacterium]